MPRRSSLPTVDSIMIPLHWNSPSTKSILLQGKHFFHKKLPPVPLFRFGNGDECDIVRTIPECDALQKPTHKIYPIPSYLEFVYPAAPFLYAVAFMVRRTSWLSRPVLHNGIQHLAHFLCKVIISSFSILFSKSSAVFSSFASVCGICSIVPPWSSCFS